MIVARAHPHAPTEDGWRSRVRAVAERGARAVVSRSIAALTEREGGGVARATGGTTAGGTPAARGRAPGPEGWVGLGGGAAGAEVLLLVPGGEEPVAARAAESVLRELQAGLPGCTFAVGRSRIAEDPSDLPRAASEALLAANVAEGEIDPAHPALAFEQTGAYRLLLSTMSDNPGELQRFYAETVEPLVAYDEQYETELVRHARDLPRGRRQRRRHRAAPVHPPPHDLLPPRARARALAASTSARATAARSSRSG